MLGRARGILRDFFGEWRARGFQARCFRATRVAVYGMPVLVPRADAGSDGVDCGAWLRRQRLGRRDSGTAEIGTGAAVRPAVSPQQSSISSLDSDNEGDTSWGGGRRELGKRRGGSLRCLTDASVAAEEEDVLDTPHGAIGTPSQLSAVFASRMPAVTTPAQDIREETGK